MRLWLLRTKWSIIDVFSMYLSKLVAHGTAHISSRITTTNIIVGLAASDTLSRYAAQQRLLVKMWQICALNHENLSKLLHWPTSGLPVAVQLPTFSDAGEFRVGEQKHTCSLTQICTTRYIYNKSFHVLNVLCPQIRASHNICSSVSASSKLVKALFYHLCAQWPLESLEEEWQTSMCVLHIWLVELVKA